jgi:hypothetical protein
MMLLGIETLSPRRFFAEMNESADLISKFRQRSVIAGGQGSRRHSNIISHYDPITILF